MASSGRWKSKRLAIQHQLDAGIAEFRIEAAQAFARQHDRSRDVVLHLHFVGGMKIGPQLVNAPRAVLVVAHPQIIVHQLLIVELQLVAPDSVDAVHGEMLAPVARPTPAGNSASR